MNDSIAFYRKNLPELELRARRSAHDWNKDLYQDAILMWIALLDDLTSFCGAPRLAMDTWSRWCRLMSGPSIYKLIEKFEDFDDQLIHTRSRQQFYYELSESRFEVPNWRFVREYASKCISSSLGCQTQDDEFVPLLRSSLLFLKRIRGPLQVDQTDEWIQTDESLKDITIPKLDLRMSGYSLPSTGQLTTGSVADVQGARGKPGLKARASCTLSRADWRSAAKLGLIWPPAMIYPERRHVGEAEAVLLQVPKNWKKDRLITKEPAYQAWAQGIVKESLRNSVKRWTCGFCDPQDDSLNRWLIQRSGFSTIDLTSASDTVHRNWINTIPDARLRRAVWCTRTPRVKVTGKGSIYPYKAAGMGCGWTFPLECWVFSQIVLSCKPTTSWAVFGDDIVVEDSLFDQVVDTLQRYGFLPNESKSFGPDRPFKESCGLHLFHWNTVVDASPVLFPGRSTTTGVAQSPENFINLQREASRHYWPALRYIVSKKLEGLVPFSNFWESKLPFCLGNGVDPDPVWGSYPLPCQKSKKYSVPDQDRYPFALLQSYHSTVTYRGIEYKVSDPWDPYFQWLRDSTVVSTEFRWTRRR